MSEVDFMTSLHKETTRDYLGRVNDSEYPKDKAATLAKKWGQEYWDGDRRINYGGYKYIEGRWLGVANAMLDYYNLGPCPKILDVGCGKGFLLFELLNICPGAEVSGLDISEYAIDQSPLTVRDQLQVGHANRLPWSDNHFDLVISINTLHNLFNYELDVSLNEIERVGRQAKYICVESYRNEREKMNLLYWQVTCETFCTPKEWEWWFKCAGYTGDYSFIYFE